jgi:hypothetical protein
MQRNHCTGYKVYFSLFLLQLIFKDRNFVYDDALTGCIQGKQSKILEKNLELRNLWRFPRLSWVGNLSELSFPSSEGSIGTCKLLQNCSKKVRVSPKAHNIKIYLFHPSDLNSWSKESLETKTTILLLELGIAYFWQKYKGFQGF